MTALKDAETQKLGGVLIMYNVDGKFQMTDSLSSSENNNNVSSASSGGNSTIYSNLTRLRKAVPLRIACIHYCFSKPTKSFGSLMSYISTSINRNDRLRTKLHQGTCV